MRITRLFVLLALTALLAPHIEASRTSMWERNYGHGCRRHRPISARCTSEDGTWTRTEIIPPDAEPG